MVDAAVDAPKRKSQERSRTREAILVAAITLYRHEGYGAVTMRAIAQQLGFSAPAIYNYFLSKEEIFLTLQERGLQLLADAILSPATSDPLEDLRQIFVRYYQFTKTHPEYFTLLYVDPSTPRLNFMTGALKSLVDETLTRLRRCVEAGIFPPEAIEVATGHMWSIVHGAAVLGQLQAAGPTGQDHDALAASGVELVIAAIRSGLLPQAMRAVTKS